MLGIPTEVLTMLSGTVVGGVMKVMEAKAATQRAMLAALNQNAIDRSNSGTPQFQFTRRVIALTVTFCVVALPKLAAIWGVPIAIPQQPESLSLLWGMFSSASSAVYVTVGGIPITTLDTHAFAAIVGLYFGYSDRGRA